MLGMASLWRDRVKMFWLCVSGMELLDEIGIRCAKPFLQRKVVRVECKEEQRWNESNKCEIRLSLVGDNDKNGRDNSDTPCLTRGAIAGHALDNRLQDAEMGLN